MLIVAVERLRYVLSLHLAKAEAERGAAAMSTINLGERGAAAMSSINNSSKRAASSTAVLPGACSAAALLSVWAATVTEPASTAARHTPLQRCSCRLSPYG